MNLHKKSTRTIALVEAASTKRSHSSIKYTAVRCSADTCRCLDGAKVSRVMNINELNFIDRIGETTLLEYYFQLISFMVTSNKACFKSNHCRDSIYWWSIKKYAHMERSMIDQVFQGLTISRIRYAIEATSGNLNTADIDHIDAMFRKARRWGIASVVHTYEEIAADADTNLVRIIGT